MFAHRGGRKEEGGRKERRRMKKERNYIEKVIKNICHERNDISITIK
jgi:hypothetical protein